MEMPGGALDGLYDRFVMRPFALAGHAMEPALVTVLCLVLGAVLVAELLTPGTVVGSLALIPIMAAAWLLSVRRLASVVFVATGFFVLSVMAEVHNRPTLLVVGLVVAATVSITRLYATKLASLLPAQRHAVPKPDVAGTPGLAFASLTRREREVALLAAEGHSAAEIAASLNIGERTVESHLASAYSKLGINSRSKLVRMALEQKRGALTDSP